MSHECNRCQKSFSTKFNLKRHFLSAHDTGFTGFHCKKCKKCFTTKFYMHKHLLHCNNSNQIGGGHIAQSKSFSTQKVDHTNDHEDMKFTSVNDDNLSLSELIRHRWSSIRTYFKCQKVMDIFNFRVFNQKEELKKTLTRIWVTKLNSQVKLQCSLGFVLQHKTSHQIRYFHSSSNNTALFRKPKLIRSLADLMEIGDLIDETDLTQHALAKRPNSSWTVLRITNLTFSLTKIGFSKFGTPSKLPSYIMKNRSLMTLLTDRHKPFNDNLCFFRALALALECKCKKRCECISKLEPVVQKLFKIFTSVKKLKTNSSAFEGVDLKDLPEIESIFKIQITVFTIKINRKATIIYQSFKSFPQRLNLCAVNKHFCYIRDLTTFTHCYQCHLCSTSFSIKSRLCKHMKGCSKRQSKLIYKGDNFFPPLNVFEQIEKETGISIPLEERFYPYFATYDIESFLAPTNHSNTFKLSFISEHTLMSISVCSNIPNYTEPVCMVSTGCVESLVEEFVLYLEHLSDVSKQLCCKKFEEIFYGLELFSKFRHSVEENFRSFQWSNPRTYDSRSIANLTLRLESYCQELPVIGFNSQKYDINCMKTPLVRFLLKHDKIKFAIKRDNAMKCIKTSCLKFLDILNYLAPGYNYESFIKAFNCKMKKGFFPYEYVTSLEKLDEPCLPPHDAFYSCLKQKNISFDEYEQCQQAWCKHKMKSMRDYLIYYNNLDVVPFLEAIEKQHEVYRSKGIDMFKDGVSVPSLATKWLFLESETDKFSIPLLSKKNADLYATIRKNIVGGPSIVFHRHHEQNKTLIRKNIYKTNAKSCKTIYGFDANALYLDCAMKKLPTGSIIRRKSEDNFRPKFTDYFGRLSLEWLEYEAMTRGIYIQHKYNRGEQRLGQHNLPVDGICKKLKIVFQFHGCLFHGCPLTACPITKGKAVNPINNKTFLDLYKDTKEKESYIKALGFELQYIYECQWNYMKNTVPKCKKFVKSYFAREMEENKPMKECEILKAVKDSKFYGFVECDIYVPDNLKELFSEMPPIFKHALLSRNDLSEEMLDYALEHNILRQPQKTLIGSYFGKKVLILTTLLQWYLTHGLVVSRIYQVVQFHGHKCFTKFGESVCQMRRAADKDPTKKIIAETAKLCGNVIYGTTITNKENFTDVKYVTDISSAVKLANSKHFISIDELSDDVFEVQLSKERIKLDTPIVVGFAILQLAKLKMLEFYYDLMCKYFSKKDFQYVTMDTDSAYFATSGDFEDIVLSSKRHEFYENFDKWFVPPFCLKHKDDFIQSKLMKKVWKLDDCCQKAFNFHKRTPGLFKQEYKGNGIIALNSKTYFCFGPNGNKLSTKGIQKKHNNIQKKDFLSVLKKKSCLWHKPWNNKKKTTRY